MAKKDTVLIIGGGGREHALLKAMMRSGRSLRCYALPGNPGMEADGCLPVDKKTGSWAALACWAEEKKIDLTVVGPEIPLVEGIVDAFCARGLTVFGPDRKAARLEGSKVFAKNLMRGYDIPTASYSVFTNGEDARAYCRKQGAPIVVKVSGLAAGKGAIVCRSDREAVDALEWIFDKKEFGDAGREVVLEEMLVGEEASVFALSDGATYRILPVSQDHKPVGDGDTGPNTGGMGAYAPAPVVDNVLLARIEKEIVQPTLDAMRAEGMVYKGLLYCGVMITGDGPKVIEYNCRFGDPETQAVLPLVDCDWFAVLSACAAGTLADVQWSIRPGSCATIVLASNGYPGVYEKGRTISGIADAEKTVSALDVYHAGTRRDADGGLVTAGGRVLAISARAGSLEEAVARAYAGVEKISFDGMIFRRDIGSKGIERLKKQAS